MKQTQELLELRRQNEGLRDQFKTMLKEKEIIHQRMGNFREIRMVENEQADKALKGIQN